MKILMFGWEFPPFNSGGLGTACYGITKAMSKKGFKINFVLPRKFEIANNFLNIIFPEKLPQKIRIKEFDSLLDAYATTQSYRKKSLLRRNSTNTDYCNDLIQEAYKYSIISKDIAPRIEHNIIHVHDWITFPAGIEAKRISGMPLVVHVHSTELDRSGGYSVNQQVFDIEKEGIQNADSVIAVSNFTKNRIIKNYNVSRDKIKVVYNAIDKNEFCDSEEHTNHFNMHGKKIVLFLGRLTLQKGPDYFLRTAKKVLERNKDVVFVISGSGDMEEQTIKQAASFGIADKVLFTGFLRGHRLKEIYKMASLYVMSSVSEPFGISSLEAAASKTPVLISKQSGASEVLNHCLKVDFWDTDEMANKIIAVLENKELEECLSNNEFIEIGKFSWDNTVDKIIELYSQLVARTRLVY